MYIREEGEVAMIVAKGEVLIYNTPYIIGESLKHNFKATMQIHNKGYICQICPIEKENIKKGECAFVEFKILDGEIDLQSFIDTPIFKLISSKEIGEGKIIEIVEIIIESFSNMSLKPDKMRHIIETAETMGIKVKCI